MTTEPSEPLSQNLSSFLYEENYKEEPGISSNRSDCSGIGVLETLERLRLNDTE